MADNQPPLGNPAVVGLAGFGLTTLILQLHNLGLCGLGPIVALGLVFGGMTQLIAGYQEFKAGNNFGYSAFCSYGAFWIALSVILLFNKYDIYKSSTTDIGYFLIVWTLYTIILWVGAMRIHGAMASTFTLLVAGFILLDLAHFGYPAMTKVAAYVLILCALNAWYMMAHVIFKQIFGRDVLPVGRPWIDPKPVALPQVQQASASH
ncbi:MAG: hypothetical protein A2X81_09160 [Desulfobacterales bacterium GWB2_56_26]|nr:MAG: hypothetical protein A2X81_09160 [Desulfobacterales bacterium GWB2_56_26]